MELNLRELFLFGCTYWTVYCAHFRGATFMWAPSKDGSYITITFRISWKISTYKCDDTTISSGKLIGTGTLSCYHGCSGNVGSLLFRCTDYSPGEYSSGTNSINFTQPTAVKQFTFGYSDGDWLVLLQGRDKDWSFRAKVDLSVRSDTGKINTSPTVYMPPVLKLQRTCSYTLLLPVADVDGDVVKCRWATGNDECAGVCQNVPGAVLNQTACTISYTAGTTIGYYAVALQIEDFANQTSATPLSSIPLQFLVYIYYGTGCVDRSSFVPPTPRSNARFVIDADDTLNITIKAQGPNTFSRILAMSAIDVTRTTEETSREASWSYITMSVIYKAVTTHAGQDHTLCFYAKDTLGVTSDTRCITIHVANSDNDNCDPNPCQNGATCKDGISDFNCICPYGFTGDTCSSDIDECLSSPCQNNANCSHGINSYTCSCLPGYAGVNCEIDIDECTSNPCQNDANCEDRISGYVCTCETGYGGINCEIDIDECADGSNNCDVKAKCTYIDGNFTCTCIDGYSGNGTLCSEINECDSSPCKNAGKCTEKINGYTCRCVGGYDGINCEQDIDECLSSPCQNNANCSHDINSYACSCMTGYTGVNCETDIDECTSNPCQNSANCEDRISGYVCSCETGYAGINCETDTDNLLADKPSKYTVIVGAVLGCITILFAAYVTYSLVDRFKRLPVKETIVTKEEDTTGEEDTSYVNEIYMNMVEIQGQHSSENRPAEMINVETAEEDYSNIGECRRGDSKVYETIY